MIYEQYDPDLSEKFVREFGTTGRVPVRYAPGYNHARHENVRDWALDLHSAIVAREEFVAAGTPYDDRNNVQVGNVGGTGYVSSPYRIGYE